MSRDDGAFRRLIRAVDQRGVLVEVDDVSGQWPLTLTGIGLSAAASVPLTVSQARELFDALAEALGTVEYLHATAAIAAGRDTPADPGSGPLSPPSARV